MKMDENELPSGSAEYDKPLANIEIKLEDIELEQCVESDRGCGRVKNFEFQIFRCPIVIKLPYF